MYWPLGAPRRYAQQLPLELSQLSANGIDDAAHIGQDAQVENELDSVEKKLETIGQQDVLEQSHRDCEVKEHVNGVAKEAERHTDGGRILSLKVSRHGHLFATITSSSLTVWQTQPPVIIASIVRSVLSMDSYGTNVSLLLRPAGDILVLHTSLGYLITYSISIHPEHRPYDIILRNGERRRRNMDARSYTTKCYDPLFDGGGLCPDASLSFRMVMKLDAGITRALALDSELIVATYKPAAIQCIRWNIDSEKSQTNTELIEDMEWLEDKSPPVDIVYDRPMSLFTFVTSSGAAYAVQKTASKDRDHIKGLFTGHKFHTALKPEEAAVKSATNSRFSIIAIGCVDGSLALYNVRDYNGGINLLYKVQPSLSRNSTGAIRMLTYSPDGYCLFVGYENGWATWSVYGQPGGSSFSANNEYTELSSDTWLKGVVDGFWTAQGTDIVLLDGNGSSLWMLEFARSAIAGCPTSANIARTMLQTSSGFMVYRGYQMPDLLTIAADISLWQFIKTPAGYLADQGPIRFAVMSSDGRYLAIAGQRGLAHYSFQSGRWRTFEDVNEQNSFAVRGGMCWHHHILIAATDGADGHEIRLYSRETALSQSRVLHVEKLTAAAVHLAPSGEDSILVYTYNNVLDHYIVAASNRTIGLVKVGQIALHGIIRAPPRVRTVSWVVPEPQLRTGDPSQDVAVASVFFLVDGKLVLLQPSATSGGELKYDMRVVAHNVEYYMLARDSPEDFTTNARTRTSNAQDEYQDSETNHNLGDSLWVFDGRSMKLWPNVGHLLASAAQDVLQELQAPVTIPLDFYPLSVLLEKGILFGVEAELLQRRDSSFALFRTVARTALFLPSILQHYLSTSEISSASSLSTHYANLPYFPHSLELLLHHVLDDAVDSPPPPSPSSPQPPSLLQTTLSFLSLFPAHYHAIIVQCARKTELRSWRTLFAFLPPPLDLFEQSLAMGDLKIAGGYLLVLHSLSEMQSTSPQVIRLLRKAMERGEWELCKELARFLMALDETGATLREALALVEMPGTPSSSGTAIKIGDANGADDEGGASAGAGIHGLRTPSLGGRTTGLGLAGSGLSPLVMPGGDYFSTPKRLS